MKAKTHKIDMGRTPANRKFSDDLLPVSPGESGQGLPYAPVDWPNPGDTWRWAPTGKAIKQNGMYKDRFLFAPKRLQKTPSKRLAFMSKKSVEHYLRSEFPKADIDAFFQSFNWDILAKTNSKIKGNFATSSQEKNRRLERVGGIFKRRRQSSLKQKGQGPSGVTEIIDMTIEEEGILVSGETSKCMEGSVLLHGQASGSHADSVDGNICGSLLDCKLKTPNFTPEEFDNYLNSLDEIIAMSYPVTVNGMPTKNRGIEVRQKLSSLLAMGFPILISSDKLKELLALASELQNDPSLSHKELSILKLIQEIPSISQCYVKVKEASEQADKFFLNLESKIASFASLKSEYNKAREEKEVLQAEEASTLLAIFETNDEIDKLQARRMALAEDIKKNNKRIVQCDSTQQKVMVCLPRIVSEVQVANSEKAEWELKKKKLAEQEAKILAKFAPLLGFSFHNLS